MLRRSAEDQESFEKEVYCTYNDLRNTAIKTRFKLVNEGIRHGSPIKVEVECQLDPKNPPRKYKKGFTKKLKNITTPELKVDEDVEA